MKQLGVYCSVGEHGKCPRVRSCSCECHDDRLEEMTVGATVFHCGIGDCPFTSTHAPGMASHRRAAHGSNIKPVSVAATMGRPTAASPADAMARALDAVPKVGDRIPPGAQVFEVGGIGAEITAGGLVWEDPPPKGLNNGGVAGRALPAIRLLRKWPGAWARISTCKSKSAASTQIRPLKAAYPDCEFVARRFAAGSGVWARATPVGDGEA